MLDINPIQGAIPFNGEGILSFTDSSENQGQNLLNWKTLAVAGLAVYLITDLL